MTLLKEHYLALSQMAYQDFDVADKGKSINNLLLAYNLKGMNAAMLTSLTEIGEYKLVNFSNNMPTGFAGIALQAPDPLDENDNPIPDGNGGYLKGEIIFAFRGTESFTNGLANTVKDFTQDLILAMDEEYSGTTQFDDAFSFYTNTLQRVGPGNYDGYSFTGHSLGGGLAQYMTYMF